MESVIPVNQAHVSDGITWDGSTEDKELAVAPPLGEPPLSLGPLSLSLGSALSDTRASGPIPNTPLYSDSC